MKLDQLTEALSKKQLNKRFKKITGHAERQVDREDWQNDIDDDGRGVGICPDCGGKAVASGHGKTLKDMRAYLECEDCGKTGPESRY